jgi:acyl-coenzyme A thioesterase PaaI-like protein
VAVGTLLKLGRQLGVAEVAMYSVGSDEALAKAQVTYSIPPP